MKKRTESDIIGDYIRRRRLERFYKKRKDRIKEYNKKINEIIRHNTSNSLGNSFTYYKKDKLVYSKHHWNLKKIPCPETLCLDSNPDETIRFLKRLPGANVLNENLSKKPSHRRRKNYKSLQIKSYFDFTTIKKICPASTLIISSCYSLYKRTGANIRVYDWENWNDEVKDTLEKMGFFDLIGFDLIESNKDLQKIPIKGFKSGIEANGKETTKYLERLVQEVDEKFYIDKDDKSFKQTAAAIIEAVENSVRHAYPEYPSDPLNLIEHPEDTHDKWWLGGILSSDKKGIKLVCYDKGVSIPKHIKELALEKKGHRIRVKVGKAINLLIKKTGKEEVDDNFDHIRLELAMKYTQTSTKKRGNGKGLSRIVDTIKEFPYGEVKIMSRRASAVITKDKDPVCTLLDTPIIGTLIIWEIRL